MWGAGTIPAIGHITLEHLLQTHFLRSKKSLNNQIYSNDDTIPEGDECSYHPTKVYWDMTKKTVNPGAINWTIKLLKTVT